MPYVSVIMTSYNYGKYISESIESVLGQTFSDLELIVIDDMSVDGSREIIRSYADRDSRVRCIFHSKNQGISRSINEGIEAATGKFVAFIDSDDIWARDKLEKQLRVLENNEDLVVWSEGETINRDGKPLGTTFTGLHRATARVKTGNIFAELARGNFIATSSLILKKDNLKGVRLNEIMQHFADYPLFLDLAWRYDFYFIDEPLTKYRIHGNNITLKSREKWNSEMIRVNTHIIENYATGLDRWLLSRLYCLNGIYHFRVGCYYRALECLFRGIKTYPLNVYYLLLLPVSAVKYRLRIQYRYSATPLGTWRL